MWYMIRNLRCTVTIDSVLANSKTQNPFLFTVNAIFLHDYPLAVEPGSTLRPLVQKKTWRDSLPIDMLISAVFVLVVAQSSSEIPEGLMNNSVFTMHGHTNVKCTLAHCIFNWYTWVPGHNQGAVAFLKRKPLPRSTPNSTVTICSSC